ncbi:MAG: glycogen synthase [Ktedonobacterales bacterium]
MPPTASDSPLAPLLGVRPSTSGTTSPNGAIGAAGSGEDGAIPETTSAPRLDVAGALKGPPLRILFVASEGVPFVKLGGPADVIGALPKALRRLGHDVRVVLPRYAGVDPARWQLKRVVPRLRVPMEAAHEEVAILAGEMPGGVPVYFVDAPRFFSRENIYGYTDDGERFILFCRAALEMTRRLGWAPDLLHCHDWHTAIIPNWMRTLYRDDPQLAHTATVFTIHNLAFQGIFGYRILEIAGVAEQGFIYPAVSELANVVDLMGRGIHYADIVSTVSPRYAREILTPQFGERLDPILRERRDRLYGILNGIDAEAYDPATDRALAAPYAQFDAFALERRAANKRALQEQMRLPADPRVPLIGMVSRLADQKGLDLLDPLLQPLIEQGAQLVVSGTGDQHYHQLLERTALRHQRQVAVRLTFENDLSQRIYAGSDLFLMPSRFEPCGLSQMLAMRYGSIPIVHQTGGLADTVQEFDPAAETGNGFTFARYDPYHLFAAIMRALEAYRFADPWRELMLRAMLADYSWDASAEQYVALYRRAQELHQVARARDAAERSASQAGA